MAGQTSRTTRKTADTESRTADTASVAVTGVQNRSEPAVDVPPRPSRPSPSPRTGVAVSAAVVETAFTTGDASQSVGYVQHILRARGFEPGNVQGIADHATRVAVARFQESIGERPTGLPSAVDLDFLGFDVIG
jgi:peptidoglycan hydrolase-like protein with peptidoglycan-binding domain